jgi:hypothetical protein
MNGLKYQWKHKWFFFVIIILFKEKFGICHNIKNSKQL